MKDKGIRSESNKELFLMLKEINEIATDLESLAHIFDRNLIMMQSPEIDTERMRELVQGLRDATVRLAVCFGNRMVD